MGILRVGKECEMTIERKIGFEMLDGGEIVRAQNGNKLLQDETKFEIKITGEKKVKWGRRMKANM